MQHSISKYNDVIDVNMKWLLRALDLELYNGSDFLRGGLEEIVRNPKDIWEISR